MAIIKKPSDHPYFPLKPKIGVLLVNLGTPDGTDYWSMRKYLKQFLMDRRVVDIFKPLWWLILNGPILTFRPSKSGRHETVNPPVSSQCNGAVASAALALR